MILACHLREIRGARSLGEIVKAACIDRGLSKGALSDIERGRRLAPDAWVEPLERAYGAPAHEWYPRQVLLVIRHPEDEA